MYLKFKNKQHHVQLFDIPPLQFFYFFILSTFYIPIRYLLLQLNIHKKAQTYCNIIQYLTL